MPPRCRKQLTVAAIYFSLAKHASKSILLAQNIEGILPVATLSIALYVLRRFMSASDVAPEVTVLSSTL